MVKGRLTRFGGQLAPQDERHLVASLEVLRPQRSAVALAVLTRQTLSLCVVCFARVMTWRYNASKAPLSFSDAFQLDADIVSRSASRPPSNRTRRIA